MLPEKFLIITTYYYLRIDVCVSFCGCVVPSVVLWVCGSVCLKKQLFDGCKYKQNVSIKSCHIFKENKYQCPFTGTLINMVVLFLIFLDQICPKWIKLDRI